MTHDSAELLKKALHLSAAERAELADSLIESLDQGESESAEAAWDVEILRRLEDLETGRVKSLSLAEARRRLSSAME